MNRRSLLTSALVVLAAQRLPPPAWGGATGPAWRRGTSVFGDLKYPAGFKQFDYVNAAAPKGGTARQLTFTFDGPGNRSRPQVLGQLVILPKAWWEGTDKEGKKRDPGSTTLEPPLGSGPCRIKEFTPGRSIVYERVKDYWGQAVSVNVGRDNFDELRFEYFRDITVAMEAFKVDAVDWRIENSAKNWATAYDFPAVADKRVVLEEFPIKNVGMMQAFAFNLRRQKFQDPRVRLAFNYAFDFEDMNNELFFGQYRRIDLDDEQIVGAINALVRRDTALAKRVIVADDRVDALQLEIEEKAATTIARRQPMIYARFWELYALPTILSGLAILPKILPSG